MPPSPLTHPRKRKMRSFRANFVSVSSWNCTLHSVATLLIALIIPQFVIAVVVLLKGVTSLFNTGGMLLFGLILLPKFEGGF